MKWYNFRYFGMVFALLLFQLQTYAVSSSISAGGELGAGGYGIKIGCSIGTDTSSGLIKYDLSIQFGQAKGFGAGFSADLLKLGTGKYSPGEGGSFKWDGSVPLGDNASFSGTISSDGSYEGTLDVKTPNGLKLSLAIDSNGNVTAGAGTKISAGNLDVSGASFTYHISGVLYDPYAPVESYGDALKKGLFEVWAAPGTAVAQAHIAVIEMSKFVSETWKKLKNPLEHPFVLAYKEQHPKLNVPKIDFINIDDYCKTRDLLGVESDYKEGFAILTEDYTFTDLWGREVTIPKGFIFDGASIPKTAWIYVPGIGIEDGSRWGMSTLAAALIHDYMYRNPQNDPNYTKDYADLMFLINTDIAGNKNPEKLWHAVQEFGDDAFETHEKNREKGLYQKEFTDEYYKKNIEIYEKYKDRWTAGQKWNREGVSVDNKDCLYCTPETCPGIVDNRKKVDESSGGGSDNPGNGSEGGSNSGGSSGNGADNGSEGGVNEGGGKGGSSSGEAGTGEMSPETGTPPEGAQIGDPGEGSPGGGDISQPDPGIGDSIIGLPEIGMPKLPEIGAPNPIGHQRALGIFAE